MDIDQLLLLMLAAPVTYLLLFVLLRLEELLPSPERGAHAGRHAADE